MNSYYIKSIFRVLIKNRTFSIINIIGLSIGLAASILILQYVFYELSFDKHLKDSDRIYRLKHSVYNKGKLSTVWASGCASSGIAIKNVYPEVEDYVRMKKSKDILVSYNENAFKESALFYSTESFFKVFPYKILQGNKNNVLTAPYHIVITKRIADKYFPNDDPIGKTLKIDNRQIGCIVEAVCENPQDNTHLKFDFLVSWSTWDIFNNRIVNDANTWNWYGFLNYVKLYPDVDPMQLESKFPTIIETKRGSEATAQNKTTLVIELQAVQDIHLYSNFRSEVETNGNGKTTYFLMFIAIFLIIIAWINYINISTARSIDRAKEVGLKKVVGASNSSLLRQFLFESVIMNLLALVLALFLILLFIPIFNELIGARFDITYLFNGKMLVVIMAIFLSGSILVGLYPAIVLSSFEPISVIKGRVKSSSKGIFFRKISIVFQFVISLILIAGTMIISAQMSFMKNQNKNFSYKNVLVLKGPLVSDSTYTDKYNTFKQELLQKAAVDGLSASGCIPGRTPTWSAAGIRLEGDDPVKGSEFRIVVVDYDFKDIYQLQLLAGRFFSKEFSTDISSILLNESGMHQLGINQAESIIDKRIWYGGNVYNIIGVIKDYNQESLRSNFDPYLFRLMPNARSFYSLAINPKNSIQLIEEIDEVWKKHFPGLPFEYFFAENYYNEQYKAEDQFGIIFLIFSILAIIIASLGLYGLASYSASQRTKEIGIRKVLGASSSLIIKIFIVDYLKLLSIAIFIGLPICFYILNRWLLGFANHISIKWWLLALPAIIVAVIVLITISSNALKSAIRNPIESINYE